MTDGILKTPTDGGGRRFESPKVVGRQTWFGSRCNEVASNGPTILEHAAIDRFPTKVEVRSLVCVGPLLPHNGISSAMDLPLLGE